MGEINTGKIKGGSPIQTGTIKGSDPIETGKIGGGSVGGDQSGGGNSKSILAAANAAGSQSGVRFEAQADGTYQKFVDGRKDQIFSETEIQASLTGLERINNAATNPQIPAMPPGDVYQDAKYEGSKDPGAAGGANHPFLISSNSGDVSVAGGWLFESTLDTDPLWVNEVSDLSGSFVWLKVTSNNGYTVTSAEIKAGGSWPTPLIGTTLPYTLYIPIGQIVDDEVQQWRRDHIYLAVAHGTPGTILIPR